MKEIVPLNFNVVCFEFQFSQRLGKATGQKDKKTFAAMQPQTFVLILQQVIFPKGFHLHTKDVMSFT